MRWGAIVVSVVLVAVGARGVLAQTGVPATLTVNTATLVSIAVIPAAATMPVGVTQQFTAIATYNDTSTLDVTANPATAWTSGTPGVASVSSTLPTKGLATGVAPGTVRCHCESGVVSSAAAEPPACPVPSPGRPERSAFPPAATTIDESLTYFSVRCGSSRSFSWQMNSMISSSGVSRW